MILLRNSVMNLRLNLMIEKSTVMIILRVRGTRQGQKGTCCTIALINSLLVNSLLVEEQN